jgi:pimeloyl-ACP methyl ester carboxylesterase
MRPGDRLTAVGNVSPLERFDDLRAELAGTPAGSPILLRWYRGRIVRRVSPPLGVLPIEAVPGSLVRYDSVAVDGIQQRLILSEPLEGADAVVFYIQGLGCSSVDFWLDTDNTVKRLVDGWAEAGFATARVEKRGMGDSEGDCGTLSFEDERRGYAAAIRRLVAHGYGRRIFLFGHSLGGVMAPQLVDDQVIGVMVYGTVGEPWFDYTMTNFERQDRLSGLSEAEIKARQTLRAEFQTGLLFEGLSPAELILRRPEAAELGDVQLADNEHYYGRSVEYFGQLAAVDPERSWRRVWQPVLALHGEFDWVSDRADHERIARLSGGKFLSLKGMDHGFLRYDTLEQSFVSRGTGLFDPAIVEATVTWMRASRVPERSPRSDQAEKPDHTGA